MKRDLLRGLSMLVLVVGLTFVTAAVSAKGQGTRIVCDIPFEFVVGDRAMPAGRYEAKQVFVGGQVLLIASRDAQAAALRLANDLPTVGHDTQARMVFHRYGQRYFLAEVWNGDYGKKLQRSSREKAIERELAAITAAEECGPQPVAELTRNRYARVEILAEAH